MYCTQNLGIAVSAALCLAALTLQDHPAVFLTCNVAAVAAAAGAAVGAMGSTIAVEKDWVAALHRHSADDLARVNAGAQRRGSKLLLILILPDQQDQVLDQQDQKFRHQLVPTADML